MLISVLVVRLSGVETAGILTLAMSVNNVFYSIAMQGIRNYQVSDMKEKYTSGIYVSSRLIICILSFLVCVGYALIAGYSYGSSLCIVAYCLFKMAEAFYDVYAGICQKKWRMDWIGKSWMVKGILSFVGFVAVLAVTQSLLAAILAMALVSWLVIFFYDIPRAKKLDTIKIHLKEKKKYNADGGMLSAVMLPDYVIGHSDDPASGHGKNSGRCSTWYLWISCSTHNDRSDGSILCI